LLRDLISITGKPHQISKLSSIEQDMDKLWIRSIIQDYLRKKLFAQGLEDIRNYITNLSLQGLRSGDEWNKISSFDEVEIKIDPIGTLNLRQGYTDYLNNIKQLVGEYDKRKVEIENDAIAVIKRRLSQKFAIQDLHEKGYPFDLIFISKSEEERREQRIVEVKSWKHIGIVIYTDNEKSFGEENEKKGGNYWLYIVDMREDTPRILGFKRPFTTNALKFVTKITKSDRDYYVYRVVREADEVW